MKTVDGGYDTVMPPRVAQDDRDRRAVLNVCAIADADAGREVLDILGLLPTATSMHAKFRGPAPTPEPVVAAPVRRTRRRKDEPIVHGTLAGYQAHRGFHEAPCESCREAQRLYNRQIRKGGSA